MKKLSKLFLTVLIGFSANNFAQEEAEGEVNVEEVIVTATSRETSVLEVPYNISTVA